MKQYPTSPVKDRLFMTLTEVSEICSEHNDCDLCKLKKECSRIYDAVGTQVNYQSMEFTQFLRYLGKMLEIMRKKQGVNLTKDGRLYHSGAECSKKA